MHAQKQGHEAPQACIYQTNQCCSQGATCLKDLISLIRLQPVVYD